MINKKKLNELRTATIERMTHDGRGVAKVDQKPIFIHGALPSETVTYELKKQYSKYAEGEVRSVISPSAYRIKPACTHFGVCGGCSLQHLEMGMQNETKQQVLLDQLKHVAKAVPKATLAPLSGAAWGYRGKARLGVKFVIKKNKVLVGFRERKKHYLAELESCEVLNPKIGKRIPELRKLIESLENYQSIPQIEVAFGDDEAALVFRHLEALSKQDQEKLLEFGEKYHFHIYLQPNPPEKLYHLTSEKTDLLSYALEDFNLKFFFHPLDFIQTNLQINQSMVKQAIQLLDLAPHDSVLDLFCGVGNFTLPIAKYVGSVTGVEGAESLERAKYNSAFNQLDHIEFYCADLTAPTDQPWLRKQYDKILLDPPRVGAKEILPYFKQFNSKKIVYISCNPSTLARDAHQLIHEYGYTLNQAGIINMFPHTSHIEAMAVFEK